MARRNPYSTGYVAAKIRANTARRNGHSLADLPGMEAVQLISSATGMVFSPVSFEAEYMGLPVRFVPGASGRLVVGIAQYDNDKIEDSRAGIVDAVQNMFRENADLTDEKPSSPNFWPSIRAYVDNSARRHIKRRARNTARNNPYPEPVPSVPWEEQAKHHEEWNTWLSEAARSSGLTPVSESDVRVGEIAVLDAGSHYGGRRIFVKRVPHGWQGVRAVEVGPPSFNPSVPMYIMPAEAGKEVYSSPTALGRSVWERSTRFQLLRWNGKPVHIAPYLD